MIFLSLSPQNSVERIFIILILTFNQPLKTRKSLKNQGFPIKNKHRFYDTFSYHNYGAYMVGMKHCVICRVRPTNSKQDLVCEAYFIPATTSITSRNVLFDKKEGKTAMEIPSVLVGMTGFEPATSCSQSKRATNCATSRNY